MKLFIRSIDSSLTALNKNINSDTDKLALIFTTDVSDNFRMEIDGDYVLCTDDHHKENFSDLKHRKKVGCSLTVYRKDELEKTASTDNVGRGRLIDDDFDIFVYLNSCTFDFLNSQINSIKKVNDFFITFSASSNLDAFQASLLGEFEKLSWVRSDKENGNYLRVESFEIGFNLYED